MLKKLLLYEVLKQAQERRKTLVMQVKTDVCRMCMVSNVKLVGIFDCVNRNLAKDIQFCTGILVQKTDDLPKKICNDCLAQLKIVYMFKNKCLRTDKILNNLSSSVRTEMNTNQVKKAIINPTIQKRKDQTTIFPPNVQRQENTVNFLESKVKQEKPIISLSLKEKQEKYTISLATMQRKDNNTHFLETQRKPVTVLSDLSLKEKKLTSSLLTVQRKGEKVFFLAPHEKQGRAISLTEKQGKAISLTEKQGKAISLTEKQEKAISLTERQGKAISLTEKQEKAISLTEKQGKTISLTVKEMLKNKSINVKIKEERDEDIIVICGEKIIENEDSFDDWPSKHIESNTSLEGILNPSNQSISCDFVTLAKRRQKAEHCKAEMKPKSNDKCICELCGRQLANSLTLRGHMKSHQPPNMFCAHCDYKTNNRSDLSKHLKLHTDEKRYQCKYCAKMFHFCSNLYVHVRRMHEKIGVKKFECTICDSKYTCSTSLKRHILSHLNDRNFHCEMCYSRFNSRKHLKRHLKNLHNIILPKQKCGRRRNMEFETKGEDPSSAASLFLGNK